MFKNYLKIAWRSLLNQKGHSLLNILGLTIGMAAALLIGLWIYGELSFNSKFNNYNSIVQVMQDQTFGDEISTGVFQPMQLAPALRDSYGDYFEHVVTASFIGNEQLAVGEHKVSLPGNYMEPGIADMLSLQMIKGTRDALQNPTSMLISASTAATLFGETDPMGQIVKIGTSMEAEVAGIYEDLPQNSTFSNLGFIVPWQLLSTTANFEERLEWGNNWFQVYAQMKEGADWATVSELIKDVKYNNIKDGPNT
ncbi:MAG: ABC transporter permease, partial [Bacteroidota bacterium]